MQNLYTNSIHKSKIVSSTKNQLQIHESIYDKLRSFHKNNKIPHLIFHGASGSGKRTIVNRFLNMIYENEKSRMKNNIMTVNCAHGKGIKFIRDELKFFAKTNIQSNNGTLFKTIVLINADHLTIDAQSALRRCIEQFSFNTRFFIIIENKHKLLNPILSRFCEIYVPEHTENSTTVNLHQNSITSHYNIQYTENHDEWLDKVITEYREYEPCHETTMDLCERIYEKGLICLDVIRWVNMTDTLDDLIKAKTSICFDTIRKEYRYEKMLMLYIFDFLYLRQNKDLKSITDL
jgi:hypothetical protein